MQVAIFHDIRKNRSQERYANELGSGFSADVRVRHVTLDLPAGRFGRLFERRQYLRFAREQQGDINVLINPGYAYLLNAIDPRKTLVVCHDLHPMFDPDIRKIRHRLYTERYRRQLRASNRAAAIVCVSENTRRDLLRCIAEVHPDKVVAIHNGVDSKWKRVTDKEALAATRRRHGVGDRRVVLHVGNDVWYKNVAGVMKSFAQFADPDFVLVHAGYLAPATQALARRLGISDRFVQLDGVSDHELMALYSLAAVMVFPSLSEGFGWPPLEAMACSCPVISSRRGSIPEVLDEACLYADPADPSAIANGIRQIVTDERLRADLIARALVQAQKFDWRNTADRMLRLFRTP